MRLADFAAVVGGSLLGDGSLEVLGATVDSRSVGESQLFVAIKGERVDGHDYACDAVRAGAVAVLSEYEIDGLSAPQVIVRSTERALERFTRFKFQNYCGMVIGVTGSVGKTSTKEMIRALLPQAFATAGNLNSGIGMPLTLFALADQPQAIVEMGMRGPGEIRTLAGLTRPSVGVITNIGPSHIGVLGSLEAIARAKGELFAALPVDRGVAVLPAAEPWAGYLSLRAPRRIVTTGIAEGDLQASVVEDRGFGGWAFRLAFGGQGADVELSAPGRASLQNALLAAAVACECGESLASVAERLKAYRNPHGRLDVRPLGEVTLIDDTYNASPVSAEVALALLMRAQGRRVAILGDMLELGAESEEAHRKVGRIAGRSCDELVVVGEMAQIMAQGARESGLAPARILVYHSQDTLRENLTRIVRKGDTVLLKASRGVGLERCLHQLEEMLA